LSVARELLAESGFERFRIDDVAQRARASKTTLYRRWPSKYELIMEAMRDEAAPIHHDTDSGSLYGDLKIFLDASMEGLQSRWGLIFLGIAHTMQTDVELAKFWHAHGFARARARLDAIIARAIARHELPPASSARLLQVLIPATIIWATYVDKIGDSQTLAKELLDFVVMPCLRHSADSVPQSTTRSKRALRSQPKPRRRTARK
jgi:AcrR family transcriptional regulator